MSRALLLSVAILGLLGPAIAKGSPLLVIALDGFRWDYLERYPAESPTLQALRRDGANAAALIPVFPTNTFPNLYTLVTGLYPARHGIVNNDFFDPRLEASFHFNQPASATDGRWWGGEPIWVTAVRQGQKAASAFWVGSEAEVKGTRPTHYYAYDPRMPFEKRLADVVTWLTQPGGQRVSLVTFYMEEINGAGHRFGPDAPEVAAAIKLCDQRIARMLAELRTREVEPNVIIVSDHGMTSTSLQRIVYLEEHLEPGTFSVDSEGSVAALRPVGVDATTLIRRFQDVPHVKAYLAGDLPSRFRLGGNERIAPVWLLAAEGWHVGRRASAERLQRVFHERGYMQGDHGYDPALASMHGILIASGPAFRAGASHPAVENVHVYHLMAATLGLVPAPNDGDTRLVRAFLREPPRQ